MKVEKKKEQMLQFSIYLIGNSFGFKAFICHCSNFFLYIFSIIFQFTMCTFEMKTSLKFTIIWSFVHFKLILT